ncbi:hypothetical protein [Halobellus marinus]|uniref:hypothetical protein n=1 Tax=Halobellus TaxID=1073986 RepID=UPI0028A71596|nr:hypothetical protein [Halobellus sp. DFY28]
MTQIQQVLFKLETDYHGHPYYVSGHALFNAIAQRVDERTRRSLRVSHGVFVPAEYGEYPDEHSQDGYAGVLGASLPEVAAYEDLFLYRDPAQRWLLDSRARDAHNTHDLNSHGGRTTFAPQCYFGRPPDVRNHKRSVEWYVQCYVHAGGDDEILPLATDVLDGMRVGGARNYGLGELSVADTQLVDLDTLDYSQVTDGTGDGFVLEIVSPYVLASEYPGAESQSVPWWWDPSAASLLGSRGGASDGLRRRDERLVGDDDVHTLACIDHGQRVGYAGNDPVETAKNGVVRVGTHSRYGFGEFRVRPAHEDRMPGRCVEDAGGAV